MRWPGGAGAGPRGPQERGVDRPWCSAMSCSRGGPPPRMNVRTGRALKAQHWPNSFLSSRPSFSQNLQVAQTTQGTWSCSRGSRALGGEPLSPLPAMLPEYLGLQKMHQACPCLSPKTDNLVSGGGSNMPEVTQQARPQLPSLAHSRLRHLACSLRMPQTRGPGNAHPRVHSHAFSERQWQQAASEINKAKYSR